MIYQRGFSPNQRSVAAQLYADAFERKFFKLLGNKAKIVQLFQLGLNSQFCFVAIDEENQLVGLLGFRVGSNQLLSLKRREFQQVFGALSGLFKSLVTTVIFHRKPESDEQLLMDGVAVSAEVRGQGIGSKLFNELITYARSQGFKSVRLDVIDENPRAKDLYAAIGFAPVEHKKVPWPIKNLIGVSGVTTMILQLPLVAKESSQ
ncbi:MAG: hypothetical protein RL193_963 [Actinomycetota bacterium]|jgi:ribosomal protein S18 acetylase RimI-like enzyme